MKDATVMFLSRISDGSAAKDCGVWAVGLQGRLLKVRVKLK